MSYQPVVPFGGYAGWAFLGRTIDSQKEAFNESASVQRNTDYFRENIGKVESAEDLLADRRLLTVALGAFGLDEDIDSTYLIQKVLTDGTSEPDALANRLSDTRYVALSEAFGFGNDDPEEAVDLSSLSETIIQRFQKEQFEAAIGEVDESMQLALSVENDLPSVVDTDTTDNGLWFNILGNPSLRSVFQTALGLPESVGSIDLDQQVSEFRKQAKRHFGDTEVSQFSDPSKREELVRRFLALSEIEALGSGNSSAQNALSLLSR